MALSTADLQTIYNLLTNAMSAEESVRKPAEAALLTYESRPGFCSCLVEIISTKDLDNQNNARWLASVYFKNSINRYWRQRRESIVISGEEKLYLRSKLLELTREENHQVAVQLAVLTSKIARFDYPKEWPELFSSLVQQLQSADILGTQRIYMVLYRTLKELSTKRLSADQRTFAEITSQLYNYTWAQWSGDMKTIIERFTVNIQSPVGAVHSLEHQQALHLTCERWLLCVKILQLMLLSGFQSDAKSVQEVPIVKDLCPAFLQAVQSLLPYRSAFQQRNDNFHSFIEKSCLKLLKVLISVQNSHPYSFSYDGVLVPIMDFCYREITCPETHIASFDQFLILCMVLLKAILECKEYKANNTGRVVGERTVSLDQTRNAIARRAEGVLKSFMINERVFLLCNTLIRRYFMLSTTDLDGWAHDSEEFHHQQDMIQWTEQLRPCAEALYLTLFYNHGEVLAPLVVDIFKEAVGKCPVEQVDVTPDMLFKEAAYNAVGISHYEISNNLKFKTWFEGALLPELRNVHPNGRIMRRRIALILGQWVTEISDEIRKSVYYALLCLFQDQDLAVKLASCRSLCFLIQDLHFSEEDFVDYIPACFEICFQTMNDVKEFDSKVQILNLISVMIEHFGEKLLPFAEKLVQFFPRVWDESSGESLLRIQVILALQNFVAALGPHLDMCYGMLIPILKCCIDINNPDELNLLEDGMQLWDSTLSHATSMTTQLLDLFPNIVAIMKKSFDHLPVAMKIIESYILLGGASFLNLHASGVVQILDNVVGNVNQKGLLSTLPVIELLLQCFPQDAPPLLSSVLQKLVIIFISGDEADPTKSAVRASAGSILARLLVQNSNYFAHLIAQPTSLTLLQQAGITHDQNILLYLVDSWLDKADSVTIIPRKAYALALCFLLTLRESQILNKIDQILSLCTGVLVSDDENGCEETSFESQDEAVSSLGQTKETRKRQVKLSDPVRSISLSHALKENLQQCASIHGEAPLNTAMSKLHPTLFGQLQQFLGI